MTLNPQVMEIYGAIDASMEELKGIRTALYENPEIGGQEFFASRKLTDSLIAHGFSVTIPYCTLETGFKAEYDSGKKGPTVGICAEYDALPEIGHGCGHNLICTMALGAAYGLASVLERTGGKVIVFGTPAEENGGGKQVIVQHGGFDDVDVAIMCHPAGESYSSGTCRAIEALQIEFSGKTSHAGSQPEKGINALDAAVMCYSMVNIQKQYIPNSNVHGIIDNGGVAPNIIPDYASIKYLNRADDLATMDELSNLLHSCAEASCRMNGSTYRIHNFEPTYTILNTNKTLSDVFDKNLLLAGERKVSKRDNSNGATDMADVSMIVPAIHPYVGLGKPDLTPHSKELANLTVSKNGDTALLRGARALACTGYEVITSPALLQKIKAEFNAWREENGQK